MVLVAKEIIEQGFYLGEPIEAIREKRLGCFDLEIYHDRRPLPFSRLEKKFLADLKAEGCETIACSSLTITGWQKDREDVEKIANKIMSRFEFQKVSIILEYDGPKTAPIESMFKTCTFA